MSRARTASVGARLRTRPHFPHRSSSGARDASKRVAPEAELRVLVIDDDEDTIEVLREMLAVVGHHQVAVARDAEGTGAGGALLQASEDWARAAGRSVLTLNVFEMPLPPGEPEPLA